MRGKTMMTRLVFGAILLLALPGGSVGVAVASAPQAAVAEHPGGEAGEKKPDQAEAGEKLNPIKIDFGLSFWTAVVFLLVLVVLGKYAWGPISQGLQKREDHIAGQIAEAERKNEEARQLLADYEKKLVAAHDEVRGLIEQGRRDAEKVGQQVMDKAREEAAVERQRSAQQIESATLAALKELAEKSAALAVDLAGKIIGEKLKPADHRRLIEKSVSEFERARNVKVN
jgi:F-type H+-transporting ATPase subunit b